MGGRKAIDLTGKVFGRLTVNKSIPELATRTGMVWECICECGNETKVVASKLKSGNTSSCGCLRKEFIKEKSTKHGKHGTVAYKLWLRIKQRCYDKSAPNYSRYGGRGIKMFKDWKDDFLSFEKYVTSLPNCPTVDCNTFSINRKDNSKGYMPGNLDWSIRKKQTRNRDVTLFMKYKGRALPLAEVAELEKIDYQKAYKKYKGLTFIREIAA